MYMEGMARGIGVIISPVNIAWICVAGAFVAACIPIYLLLRNRPRDYRRRVLLTLAAANLALFFVYLLWFQYMPGLPPLRWDMLPINLCNLVTVLLVVALATDSRRLYGFCFYVGVVAGFAAILSPEGGLREMEVFAPLMMGFYFVHCLLYTLGLSLVTLKLLRPTYKSALWAVVWLEALTAVMYVINILLRNTVYPEANFFFLFETNGSPWLEALHGVAPMPPFTMMVSVLPVALGAFLLMTWIYNIATRRRGVPKAGD